jgi:hypothetical protein
MESQDNNNNQVVLASCNLCDWPSFCQLCGGWGGSPGCQRKTFFTAKGKKRLFNGALANLAAR